MKTPRLAKISIYFTPSGQCSKISLWPRSAPAPKNAANWATCAAMIAFLLIAIAWLPMPSKPHSPWRVPVGSLPLRIGRKARRATQIKVLGESFLAAAKMVIHLMVRGGYASDYDAHVARKLANILAGGALSAPQLVSEQYVLDLEREAFVSLCGEKKTQERIAHTLKTGKPLRN